MTYRISAVSSVSSKYHTLRFCCLLFFSVLKCCISCKVRLSNLNRFWIIQFYNDVQNHFALQYTETTQACCYMICFFNCYENRVKSLSRLSSFWIIVIVKVFIKLHHDGFTILRQKKLHFSIECLVKLNKNVTFQAKIMP